MAAIKRDVPIQLGSLASIRVTIYSAVEDPKKATGSHSYCTGTEENPHDPMRIKATQYCEFPGCGRKGWHWASGREDANGKVVLLTDAELAKLEGNAGAEMVIACHPLAQVLQYTVPGERVYWLEPSKEPGETERYAVLSALLKKNTSKAVIVVFAARSRPKMWRLQLFGDVITMQSLCWPEDLKPVPVVPAPSRDRAVVLMAGRMLELVTSDFDVAAYTDRYRQAHAELVASKPALSTVEAPETEAPAADSSLFEQLKASVDAAEAAARKGKPKSKPKPPRKPKSA